MSVRLNVVDLGNTVEELTDTSKDRVAFVEDSRDKVLYELEQRYNVLVFNRQKRKNWDVPTKGQILYRSFNYKGTTYGIWAFERAVFRYIGKNGKGAPKNLAYAGNCLVSSEDTAGTKSLVLTFELPETAKLHQVVKDNTLQPFAEIWNHSGRDCQDEPG